MPAKSKQQQKFFVVDRAMQKGDIPKKGEAGEVASDMEKKDVKKMASTKHKGLPKKIKEIIVKELIKELKLNEVKPYIDPKLKSKPTDRIQYVATNDNRYPSEIVFIDTQTGHVVFFNIQRKEVERIAWNKLNSTHWVRPHLEKEFEGFLDGWSPSGKIQYQGATEIKTGNKINIARAKAHFKQGEKIAAVDKKTGEAIRITGINQFGGLPTSKYDYAYITESKKKLNEAPVDMNDPFLVQARIMRSAAKERVALDALLRTQPKIRQYKISFDKYLELLDTQMFLQQDIAEIGKQLKQTWIDMEQEAEPEGGPKADQYGRDLMKLENEYKKLKAKLEKIDARVGKYAMY